MKSRAVELFDAAPELAVVAVAVLLIGALLGLVLLARLAVRLVLATRRAGVIAHVRTMPDVGARIIAADGGVGRRRAVARFLASGAEGHLKDFMFGGPFRIATYPGQIRSEQEAAALLERSEADVVLWAEKPRGTSGVARIASRAPGGGAQTLPSAAIAMPRKQSTWTEAVARALAYAVAKQYRPALGRPQDFRAERLKPVVETLLEILAEGPEADPHLIGELEDDAVSGALQLAISGDPDWIDRAIDLSRTLVARANRSVAPERWILAKINLGRSLRVKAERQFDPVMVRESISHLQEALEALRSEPRFRLAESAAQAIADGQRLLGARRKFSITGGGI
ncbi:MAG: hypothetical protein R3C52_14055 [Hyphomonadaceae bacterium]